MKTPESKYVAITYETGYSSKKLTAKDRAERRRLEETIHLAIKRFIDETGYILEEIELYPCPKNCKACAEASAEHAA